MESRHLLDLSIQNALDCISENFNLKNFHRGACTRNSLEKCAVRSPDGRYLAHIATVYYITRSPLSQNPPSTPVNGYVPLIRVWFSGSWVLKYNFKPVLLDPPCVDVAVQFNIIGLNFILFCFGVW